MPLELSFRQMIELEGCTRCGECTQGCPAFAATQDQRVTPIEAFRTAKDWMISRSRLKKFFLRSKSVDPERLKAFSNEVFQCTLCGHCNEVCPVHIRSKEMRIALRKNIGKSGLDLPAAKIILENLEVGRNVVYLQNEHRLDWIQEMPETFSRYTQKEKAEVAYFAGCVASYFPIAFSISRSTLQLLEKAKVDFGLLGPEEWCCGWPLIGMGKEEMAYELMNHNIEKINAMGARTLLCGCPSCYHMWKHQYPRFSPKVAPQFEVIHSTEYFQTLLKDGKIPLRPFEATVTYHDPCDLGRASGLYEPPREIIRMIPKINFVEMRTNRNHATCCGGGGDLEMFFPNITKGIAGLRAKEIEETEADIVLSACQQCKRTLSVNTKKLKKKVKVQDIVELIHTLSEPG